MRILLVLCSTICVAETRQKRYMKRKWSHWIRRPMATRAKSASPAKKSSTERVRKFRAAMRAKGLKPLTIWMPDTRSLAFIAECNETARLINTSEHRKDDEGFMAEMWSEALSDKD
jgi:hypothetical protein